MEENAFELKFKEGAGVSQADRWKDTQAEEAIQKNRGINSPRNSALLEHTAHGRDGELVEPYIPCKTFGWTLHVSGSHGEVLSG